jgi:nucleoside-diphosphate-sugar epimerase
MASDGSLRVLVTGASGYLGQFLLDEILRNGGTAGGRRILAAGTYSSRAESIPAGVLAGVCVCVCLCVHASTCVRGSSDARCTCADVLRPECTWARARGRVYVQCILTCKTAHLLQGA